MSNALIDINLQRIMAKPDPRPAAAATSSPKTGMRRLARRVAAPPPRTASALAEGTLVHTALRLRPEVRRGLDSLQATLGGTLNGLMNEGLAEFVAHRSAALEVDMRVAMERIRSYHRRDPGFAREVQEIAEDEAATYGADPVDGVAYRVTSGPSLAAIERILTRSR